MRARNIITCVLLFLTAELLAAQDAKVEYSGTWRLNEEKSEFDEGSRLRDGRVSGRIPKMIVKQKGNLLTVERFWMSQTSTVYTYALDGKPSENSSNDRSEVSTVTWSEGGKSLVFESKISARFSFRQPLKETWSLNGDNLVIETVRPTSSGDMVGKIVYDRAEE